VGKGGKLGPVWIFPLIAALVALVFAALLARQWTARRRPFQLAWSAALLMYAGGSLALFLGVLDGWSPAEYRAYWLLGAILNVPYLALGEVYLLVRDRRVGNAFLLILLFLSGFAFNRVRTAGLDVSALTKDLPLGKDVFAADTLPYRLSQLYAYPAYIFLLLGCAWSIARMPAGNLGHRRRSHRGRDRQWDRRRPRRGAAVLRRSGGGHRGDVLGLPAGLSTSIGPCCFRRRLLAQSPFANVLRACR
jgi:hypothetical protein